MFDRRSVLAGGAALAASVPLSAKAARKAAPNPRFPEGFLWGASTAPHQIEGNNVASDLWYLEYQQPTVFKEPSGDAANSFLMWEQDLDLVKSIGLNTYRFGVEWARIEPA
jgi:beta-glucosidase